MKLFGFDFGNLKYSQKENFRNNRKFLKNWDISEENSGFSPDGFIEDQHKLEGIKYASRDFAYCGCGCIAYYNILKSRGKNPDLPMLASEMEKGTVLGGVFGTNGYFLQRFMQKRGEKVDVSFDFEKGSKEGIVLYYKKPRTGHFVAYTLYGKDENGEDLYRLYNVGGKIQRRFGEGTPVVMKMEDYIKETAWNISVFYRLS